jgi:ubiquitin carboxyl-terminal hydrolase 8
MNSYKNVQDKGLTALANLGNTCFMNATLQCLSYTFELNDFLDKKIEDNKEYKKKLKKNADALVLVEWDTLRTMMWSENCVISPGGFLGSIQKVARIKQKTIFTGYAQNDLPEFLNFMIDCFHNSLCREVIMNIKGTAKNNVDNLAIKCFNMMKNMYKKEYSEILTMFFGISVSTLTSLQGEKHAITPEPFFMIQAPLPVNKQSATLYECLDRYTESELLTGDNKYFNEKKNQKEEVYKDIKFWDLPNVLIITLKRFSNDMKKNKCAVDFPLEDLDMSRYVIGYNKHAYIYDLYAICNHGGSVMGGHYTASIKNGNKWYLFNDTNISPLSKIDKNEKPYCFFYRKKKLLNNI